MGEHRQTIAKIIFVVVALTLGIWWSETDLANRRAKIWTESYPIANQNITWSGAGYNGIYE